MSEPELETFAMLELPGDVDLPDARLRFAAALVVLPFAIVLVALPGVIVKAFGIAGLVASVFWLVAARRTRREVREAPRRALALVQDHVALIEGSREQTIAWTDVESIEIDDERAAVVVRSGGGDELVVRPGYGHLGLEPLLARVVAAWRASASGSDLGARTPDRG